jgi:hypothetical protein|tara:strand:+ start:412 stop:585 length:174 start_codon:yes stop_codon:yes gene_type:complete
MGWNNLDKNLPKDKQEIIVYDEGLGKELKRTFSLKFWEDNHRVLWCSEQCRKWKPNN